MNIKTTTLLLLLLYSDYNNRRCGVVILIEIEATPMANDCRRHTETENTKC